MSKRRYMIELEEIVDVSEVDNSRVYPNQEIKVMTSDKVHLKKRLDDIVGEVMTDIAGDKLCIAIEYIEKNIGDDWAELIKLRSQIKIA